MWNFLVKISVELLQVVPSYEHGELILKNYKESLKQTKPTVFVPDGNPNTSEVLLGKDVVYSEVLDPSTLSLAPSLYSLATLYRVLIVALDEPQV